MYEAASSEQYIVEEVLRHYNTTLLRELQAAKLSEHLWQKGVISSDVRECIKKANEKSTRDGNKVLLEYLQSNITCGVFKEFIKCLRLAADVDKLHRHGPVADMLEKFVRNPPVSGAAHAGGPSSGIPAVPFHSHPHGQTMPVNSSHAMLHRRNPPPYLTEYGSLHPGVPSSSVTPAPSHPHPQDHTLSANDDYAKQLKMPTGEDDYINIVPYQVMWKLSNALDAQDKWRALLAAIDEAELDGPPLEPGYVHVLDNCFKRRQSPTETLLNELSQKGYKIAHLKHWLHHAGLQQALDFLEESAGSNPTTGFTSVSPSSYGNLHSYSGTQNMRPPVVHQTTTPTKQRAVGQTIDSLSSSLRNYTEGDEGGENQQLSAVVPSNTGTDQTIVLRTLASRFGPLEIVDLTPTDEQLGRGSDAMVYRVVWRGVSYAGKQLHNFHHDDQKCVDSFIFECTKWSQLKHPNIVKFVGVFFKGDSPIPMLIMEKMDTSLWLHLQRHSKEQFTTESKTSVLRKVTEALVYLHSRSPPLIHCDVSPNNILLNCNTLETKLSDFGMTRTAAYAQATIKSSVKGTQAFIAPEAQKVPPQYDEKRDIFSFGNVVITMVTHKMPLPGPATDYNDKDELVAYTEFQRRASHLAQFTRRDNDLFRTLIENCLHNRPTKRPSSEELMKYLKRLQGLVEGVGEFLPYIDSMLPHLVVLGTVLDLENFTDAVVNDPGRHDQKCLKILKEWLCVNPGSTWTLFCEKLKHAKVFSNLRSTIQRDKLFATGQEAYMKVTGTGAQPTVHASEEIHSPPVPQQVSRFIIPENDPEPVEWSLPVFTEDSVVTQVEDVDDSIEIHSPPVPQQVSRFIIPESDPEFVEWSLPVFTEDSVVTQVEDVDDSIEQYRMKSSPRGLALIINNKVFSGRMKKREGTDLDVDGLTNLFHWLDYDVRLFIDLKGTEMISVLRDVARLDHSSVDSLVVAILTHGVENELYGSDEELIPVAEVFKLFNGFNCPSLVGKPKVFLIQACRGGIMDYGVEHTDGKIAIESKKPAQEPSLDSLKFGAEEKFKMPKDPEWKGKDVMPVEADVVVVYATVPGYVSWRNSAFGSWFIKAFVDVMYEQAAKSSFMDILTMVNNRVALKFQTRDGNKQMPQATWQLTKLLYFNPPIANPRNH